MRRKLTLLGQLCLLRLLRICRRHRIDVERQHAAQRAGNAADGAADAGLTEDAADGGAERTPHLADDIAEPALGCDLILLRQLGQLGLLRLLRICRRHRIDVEGQHAAQRAGNAADGAAQARLAEQAADGAAQRTRHLADHVAEPTLGIDLLGQLRLLLQVLQLLQLLLLLLLRLLRISLRHGVGAKWQQAADQAADAGADVLAEAGSVEQAADALADQAAQGAAKQAAGQELRFECLSDAILLL